MELGSGEPRDTEEKPGGENSTWLMELRTGKLTLAEASEEYKHDTTYLEKALKEADQRKGKILIDGIADSQRCYELAQKHNKELITPPKQGAIIREEPCYKKRNEAIQAIQGLEGDRLARSIWES